MPPETLRERIGSAFAGPGGDESVDEFLSAIRENQQRTEQRFRGLAWLLILLLLLFELLIGGGVASTGTRSAQPLPGETGLSACARSGASTDTPRGAMEILGVPVPTATVRDALPAAIAATYLALMILGLIRMRQLEVHDLILAEHRGLIYDSGLRLYLRPASLLQASVLLDGVESKPRRWLFRSGPLLLYGLLLFGPLPYVGWALWRCFRRDPTSLFWLSAPLAVLFCLYGLTLVLASPRQR